MNEKEPIINELGADPDSLPFLVNRPFYLTIKAGPSVIIPAGSLVRLKDVTRLELFHAGRIAPTFLRDNDIYKVVRSFRHTTEAGEWLDLHPGQKLRLSVTEATELLRKNLIVFDPMQEED
ncbi:hypothetical protein NBG4_1070002 [Candidatus Sulfobium mesophilum]|uniref:Uncharacterized protein n=1 Tax=Candidatus Sulfobium mesophilum TaxID=2016548 RepID=A0A2U3QE34_9BACT|nr:hypothetical protein NBG4_1070002 [Candidatus Sulfobium mesophilum]